MNPYKRIHELEDENARLKKDFKEVLQIINNAESIKASSLVTLFVVKEKLDSILKEKNK